MQKFYTVSRTGTRNDDGPLLPHFETSSSKRKDMENNRVRSLATSNSPSSQLRCKSDKPSFVPLKKQEKARCMVDDLGSFPDAAVMIRKKVLPLFPVLSSRLSPSWASPPRRGLSRRLVPRRPCDPAPTQEELVSFFVPEAENVDGLRLADDDGHVAAAAEKSSSSN